MMLGWLKQRAPRAARLGTRKLVRAPLVCGLGGALAFAVALIACLAFPYPRASLAPANTSSLTIVDRRGHLLWQAAGPHGGRESWTPLPEISMHLRNATLAAEDHRFFDHSGIDPRGLARALWLNVTRSRSRSGGSTITMQLSRLLRPELAERSLVNKARQVLDAARLERALSKSQILEQYLNRVYYGHGAWGVAAAARHFFDKSSADLPPAEAALLAVLPRGPRLYDPDRAPEALRARRDQLLGRMHALGWLDARAHAIAVATPMRLAKRKPAYRAPHFVDLVRSRLPEGLLKGTRVETTLDLALQERVEVAVQRHLASIGGRHLTQAGIVIMRNQDGAILAMVGSGDYAREPDGAVNVITAMRRPGSTLKPFVYALAMEQGDSPATLAFDVILPGEALQPYTADVKQHGFARYREALAGSYNLAAVHTLARVGVPSLLARLRKAGVHSLRGPDESYGLGLAIGEAEFTALEYTGAFAAFGTGGLAVRPHAISHIEKLGASEGPRVTAGERIIRHRVFEEDVAYLVFDMLSDSDARRPMFARQAPMELPFAVALKTGTTRAYTDTLAFGTTAQYTVGAWGGNFDGSPTQTVMAMQGAAPLVRAAFVALAALYGDPTAPPRPDALVRAPVCGLSGRTAGPECPGRKWEWFRSGTQPDPHDVCPFHVQRCGKSHTRFPPELEGWARSHGLLAPDPCGASLASPPPRIVYPMPGALFRLDAHRPLARQLPPLRATPENGQLRWLIDGQALGDFVPTPGPHTLSAISPSGRDSVQIRFEGGPQAP